jgi:hypothetical protein
MVANAAADVGLRASVGGDSGIELPDLRDDVVKVV